MNPVRFLLLCLLSWLLAAAALAQNFPALSGRVVDQADLLSDLQEQQLSNQLENLEQATSRQLVVATIASLQNHPIEDYGYRLGRNWGIGRRGADNGAILIVAPNERKVRIEVGYGLEGIMTDALSGQIIRETILPRFREDDYAGGIMAGAEAIIAQLQAPPELAEQRALAAQGRERRGDGDGSSPLPMILFWAALFLVFILLPWALRVIEQRNERIYRRHGRGRRRRGGPVTIWGAGYGGGWSGGGWSGAGGGWSGGGSFGGFSGGGGSFGGGGASGSW